MSEATRDFILHHPSGIEISSLLQPAEVARFDGASEDDMGNGVIWYSLPVSEIEGEDVTIRLCFAGNRLHMISLGLADENKYGSGWNDWSEAKERTRAAHTERWLRGMGYTPGQYDWGEVWVGYDEKGASGGAGISFKAEHDVASNPNQP
ncbi:MAG: hypothetical protein HRU46_15340 [Verrucomicrobiales bacterium]|nr:hypothetical protein [Verrucomicrobiales bacterium]